MYLSEMHLEKFFKPLNLYGFRELWWKNAVIRHCHARAGEEGSFKQKVLHMSAWQVTSFANGGKVQLVRNLPVPVITDPHHVLVKVVCSSVNPLDVEMMRGFGRVLLKNMRRLTSFCSRTDQSSYELPITLGRDFSGVVVARGSAVTKFNVGDEVFGVTKPERCGCHAEYAMTYDSLTLKKPEHLSFSKASAVLYTTLTAWSALRISGHMIFGFSTNYPVLVIGASGGVGQAAIQLLKAWDCSVVATCRTDAIPVVEKLSPDIIIDYTSSDYLSKIKEACHGFPGKYCLILDAAGLSDSDLLKYRVIVNENGIIVSLRSPLLSNIDQYGLLGGGVKSLTDLILMNLNFGSTLVGAQKFRWAYFASPPRAMDEIEKLVQDRKLDPQIEEVYAFSDADRAYMRMKRGHLRGKIIISTSKRSSA